MTGQAGVPAPVLEGRRVLVLGLGVSGEAAAVAARRGGAQVVAADAGDSEALRERAERVRAGGIDVRLGTADPEVLAGCDLVVPSPGVPQANALLVAALGTGVEVWSEPELAWRLSGGRARLVAVTGTNGKTTTTELLSACLAAPTAGNIGTPLTSVLLAPGVPELVVVELSSFQLRFTSTLAPRVAVLLNVAADHLDWHGDLAAYGEAKANVWAHQQSDDWAVLALDDAGATEVASRHAPPGRLAGFTLGVPSTGQVGVRDGAIVSRLADPDVDVAPLADLPSQAPHHLANALAATAAALCAGASPAAVADGLRRFRPGPHRLEVVAEVGGVRWVNDSKATNPHAAAAALSSCERVVWIAGGLNKGLSFDVLADLLTERVKAVVTLGEAGPEIAAFTRALGLDVCDAGTLDAAVTVAAGIAHPGDTVLLSPACASMDQFRDYAERGQAFRDAVQALARSRREVPR